MLELTLADVAAEEASQVYRLRSRRALRRLPSRTRQVAHLFDGSRSLREVCALARISMTHGLSLAGRLAESGVLLSADVGVAFSPQEEAFFASEVQVTDDLEVEEPRSRWRPLGGFMERLRDRLEIGLLAGRDSSPSIH